MSNNGNWIELGSLSDNAPQSRNERQPQSPSTWRGNACIFPFRLCQFLMVMTYLTTLTWSAFHRGWWLSLKLPLIFGSKLSLQIHHPVLTLFIIQQYLNPSSPSSFHALTLISTLTSSSHSQHYVLRFTGLHSPYALRRLLASPHVLQLENSMCD